MKKLLILFVVLVVMPIVFGTDTGVGMGGIDFETEEFGPRLWMCNHREVMDDEVQKGRIDGEPVCSQKDLLEPFDEEVCDSECCVQWLHQCNLSLTLPPEGVPPGPGQRACWRESYCENPAPADMNNTFDHCCVLNPNVQGCEPTDECQNSSGCFLKGGELIERTQNYAFEGEKIEWEVLVMDKNKVEDIRDVIITIGAQTGEGESGCFGTPREGVCENYDYEQCLDVDGCEPLCDIFVAGNGECDGDPCFTSIQTAINNSLSGDVICVESGTYEEDLTIPTGLVNLELVSVAPVIIKGVSNVPAANWPLAAPNVEILADGVKLHGFTIESPDYVSGFYSSGIVIGAEDVEIYDNNFVTNAVDSDADISQAIQTYSSGALPGADSSGLNIHDNTFTHKGAGDYGYEAIYLNPDGASGLITIANNEFGGNLLRGISSERSKVTITDNLIETEAAPIPDDFSIGGAYQGINIRSSSAQSEIKIDNNKIGGSTSSDGFNQGIRLGSPSQSLDAEVTSNIIQYNRRGVRVWSASSINLSNNNIIDNIDYGALNNDTGNTLNAENNWWGDASGPSGAGPGSGDSVSIDVDFDPWAQSAFNIIVDGPRDLDGIICEGTPDSCRIINSYYKCRYETEGCYWVSGDVRVEAECLRLNQEIDPEECNARIDEEELDEFDPQTMAYYECTFTVERPESMYGEYWVNVESEDSTGLTDQMDENEYWFFNPVIGLYVDGDVDFGIVRPGTISYSDSLLVGNLADYGSGVLMDMFVSGTDFYDPSSSGSRCVITNRLKLGDNYVAPRDDAGNNDCEIGFGDTDDHLCYHATLGAYSTQDDPRNDAEGYIGIVYGDTFSRDFYNDAEIIQSPAKIGPYYVGNILAPGAEMSVTFKLGLPEPCVGDFTDGDIYFWGEAI